MIKNITPTRLSMSMWLSWWICYDRSSLQRTSTTTFQNSLNFPFFPSKVCSTTSIIDLTRTTTPRVGFYSNPNRPNPNRTRPKSARPRCSGP
ncbi:unnamed protein product [Amoebophrya sp. A25]|nr:unnamed protein product [Amoebophrya sp. A25]|eukprot:GSA25T00004763001.1